MLTNNELINFYNQFISTSQFLFEDSLNWEVALDSLLLETTNFFFLHSTFSVSYIATLIWIKLSILDIILFQAVYPFKFFSTLSVAFFLDILIQIENFYPFLFNLFWADYQSIIEVAFYLAPETSLIFFNYFLTTRLFIFNTNLVSFYDIYLDKLNVDNFEILENFILFFLFSFIFILIVPFWYSLKIYNLIPALFMRVIMYLYSLINELRLSFDSSIFIFIFFFFYWTFLLMTWDEAGDETIIELFNLNFFNFFLLIIFFLIWKYSIHFFSFLEATDTAGRSVIIIIKQFFRDIMGFLGLVLRFIILVFRLNVYDNLDDILDSYYIFFIDYDDMDYYNEWLFGSIFYTFFFSDYNSDLSILLENELDWTFDIYSLFFIIWGKIAFFFIFIIEEFARVFLALYISLLISFEVHAVNSSYNELKS